MVSVVIVLNGVGKSQSQDVLHEIAVRFHVLEMFGFEIEVGAAVFVIGHSVNYSGSERDFYLFNSVKEH